jgi:glutaredoxin-like protein NrdH
VKELLSREGVPFTAYNIDEDERAYDELLARGWRNVPLTVIGERVLKGFNPVELASAIAEWRMRA